MNPTSKKAIWQLVVLIAIVFIGWKVFASFRGGETEGVAKYDDCRQVITVQDPTQNFSWNTYFKNFTCTYWKTQSGKIRTGKCVYVETDSGVCTKAYVYEKKQERLVMCTHIWRFPLE
jgi:hypothetical protein